MGQIVPEDLERFTHSHADTLYYLLFDGVFRGVVAGKFRYTPDVEDAIMQLHEDEVCSLQMEIFQVAQVLCGVGNPIKRYQGTLMA